MAKVIPPAAFVHIEVVDMVCSKAVIFLQCAYECIEHRLVMGWIIALDNVVDGQPYAAGLLFVLYIFINSSYFQEKRAGVESAFGPCSGFIFCER